MRAAGLAQCAVLATIGLLLAGAASPRVASEIPGIVLTAATDLPRSPENGAIPEECSGYRNQPHESDAARLVAARGWIVTSEARLDQYEVVGFASGFDPMTSGICFFRNGNLAIFEGTALVAIAYATPAAKLTLGSADMAEGHGLLVLSGNGPTAPIGELRQEGGVLKLAELSAGRTFCSGTVAVPTIYGESIRDARAILMAKGWKPRPPDRGLSPDDFGAGLIAQGIDEVQTCSGTGVGYCGFDYSGPGGVLSVTTIGGDWQTGAEDTVIDAEPNCGGPPKAAVKADQPRADGAMTFRTALNGGDCFGCAWAAAEGRITADTPAAFAAFLAAGNLCTAGEPVTFDSPGGDPDAAMALGRALREAGCVTAIGRSVPHPDADTTGSPAEIRIDGRCEGACVLAFLGGAERRAAPEALVAAPLLSPPAAGMADGLQLAARIGAYLAEMHLDPALGPRLVLPPDAAAQPLTAQELAELSVDNSAPDGGTPWRIEPYRDGAVAVSTHRYDPAQADMDTLTLFCRKEQPGTVIMMLSASWGAAKTEVPRFPAAIVILGDPNRRLSEARRRIADPDTRAGDDGTAFLSVPLTAGEVAALRGGEPVSLAVDIEGGGNSTGWSATATLGPADRAVLALALRNCV
jgi:hypothetical protein